jgi:tRNA pseudouridine32 synthase/23S rRNA pseudouridine746 synthase
VNVIPGDVLQRRQGARRYLPLRADPPRTLLAFLVEAFPHVNRHCWETRILQGQVTLSGGDAVTPYTPYIPGETVHYRRQVDDEPGAPEGETVVFRDERLIVADKPHGMPVTPAGDYLARCLLVRLQERTGNPLLVPAHRLDRDTAGLVLLVGDPALRGLYHQLFSHGKVEREYLACARIRGASARTRWEVENRMGPGTPWFRRQIVPGPPNAATGIELIERRGSVGLFRIRPRSGKKHQIRVHMASIGHPILGDPLYPQMAGPPDPARPLQLLARSLRFVDPVSGVPLRFRSSRTLGRFPGALPCDLSP